MEVSFDIPVRTCSLTVHVLKNKHTHDLNIYELYTATAVTRDIHICLKCSRNVTLMFILYQPE